MLAGYALLMLHKGSFGEPAGLMPGSSAFPRDSVRTPGDCAALSVAVQTGL
jgi:hypothetical protein